MSKSKTSNRNKALKALKAKSELVKANEKMRRSGGKRPTEPSKKPGKGSKKTNKTQRPPPIPYSVDDQILLVGEANFSFALALAKLLDQKLQDAKPKQALPNPEGNDASPHASDASGDEDPYDDDDEYNLDGSKAEDAPRLKMVATTFDSKAVAIKKYSDASDHIAQLQAFGVVVLFDVDATDLKPQMKAFRKAGCAHFDKVIFNFPHVGMGIKDQNKNVLANQQVIVHFYISAADHVMHGNSELHVTLKTGLPYDLWDVKGLANGCLVTKTSMSFIPASFPGYAHRRTLGFKDGLSAKDNEELASKECRTYIFKLPEPGSFGRPAKKKAKKGRARNASSSDDE